MQTSGFTKQSIDILIFQDGDFLQVDLFCCCALENSADDDGQ